MAGAGGGRGGGGCRGRGNRPWVGVWERGMIPGSGGGGRGTVRRAALPALRVTGPMAAHVPIGDDNLVARAARLFDVAVAVTLDKHLPVASGLGGGSASAASGRMSASERRSW